MVDFTNLTNTSNFQQVALYTNNATDGILFTGGIIAFYIIILMYLYRNMEQSGYEFSAVFTATSWVMFIISGFFWMADLISTPMPLMFLLFSAFGTIYLYASRR